MSEQQRLVVVGGGITGLCSAYLAALQGRQVTVLEASPHFGGLLRTFPVAGTQLEHFYHHFFTHDAEIHWLVDQLGISDQLYYEASTMGVYSGGSIYPFDGAKDLLKFRPISWPDKVRFGLSSLYLAKRAPWHHWEQTPALDWLRRKAGKTTAANLWEPMLRVKFGPYAERVPLAWLVGRLRQRFNSRKQGVEKLGYLKGSLQTLLDALVAKLQDLGVELLANHPVEELEINNGALRAVVAQGQKLSADQYLFTLPTTVLSRLVPDSHAAYRQQLEQVDYFGAMCLILEMDRPLSDIYWLNVADPAAPFGGVIEHTNFVGQEHYQGKHIAYLSRYFTRQEEIATWDEAKVNQEFLAFLGKMFPGFGPEQVLKSHWFRTNTAAPVVDLGFSERVPECASPIGGMYVASMPHVYPDERSTNNSIRIAAEACRVMGIDAHVVPHNSSLAGQIGF